MSLRQIFLALGLLLLIGVWGACVDVPSGPGTNTSPDFRSQVRFVQAMPGAAAGDVKVDGNSVANLGFPNASGYLDLASGSRSVTFGANAVATVTLGSEQQSTVVIYTDVAGLPAYLNLPEGHKDKNNGAADPTIAKVKFVNVGQGASSTVSFRSDSLTDPTPVTVAFGAASQYTRLPAGSRAIFAVSNGGYTASNVIGSSRTSGSVTADLTVEGGLVYTVTLKTENSKGLFTSADIRNADSGAVGPSVFTVSVDSQNISFANATLIGANENPPVTTTSTGTIALNLNNKTGLSYNISITRDNSQGFYTVAHFHAAPKGVNGPVFYPFSVTKQTIVFPADSLKGSNEVPATTSSAGGLGTFTLYPDSLVYSITIARDPVDSTFVAMHFHNAAAGVNGAVVKNIMLTPWSDESRTFTGTWSRTDATQPLTAALITEIIAGRVYLNAHTTANPGGAVRSQLKSVPTSVNTFSGTFNNASSPVLRATFKDTIATGLMYVNFHSAANPGGQIRAQCVPDTFTTSTFTGTWNGATLTDALKEQFNLGRMYFNFQTASGAGDVRAQLKVDASKGQNGVATLAASAFDGGKMYTVIATGKGGSFQLIKLEDRLGAGAPIGKPKQAPKTAVTNSNE